jgi:hypothetical protein
MPTDENAKLDAKLKEQILESSMQEAIAKQTKMKQEASQIGRLEKQGYKEHQQQLADAAWKEVVDRSEKLIENGQQGFDNWLSAACSLVAVAHKLREAIHASDPLGMLVDLGGNLYELIPKGDDPLPTLDELPRLQYYADIKDGKLEFESLSDVKRSDGDPLFPIITPNTPDDKRADIETVTRQLENSFKEGVVLWLNQNGYKANRDEPGVFVDMNDESIRLDKAEFDRLRAHPHRGLDAFLHNKFDLDFEPKPAPSSPAPGP